MTTMPKSGPKRIILGLTTIGQILAVVLTYQTPVNSTLRNSGWIVLWIAGIFGTLPILTFRRLGKVERGRSYIHTNQLVDTGIYSIIRHPQYLSGMLISAGLCLIAPGWIPIGLGIANIVQYYLVAVNEEKRLIAKFGEEYIAYKKRVPGFNPVWGAIQRIIGS